MLNETMDSPADTRIKVPVTLPRVWAGRGIALRGENTADAAFIIALFAAVRGPDFVPLGWPPSVLQAFLVNQAQAQNRHYTATYPMAHRMIVTFHDLPVGRLYLHPGIDAVRVVDISLMPEWRGRGLGTALLRATKAMASANKLPVSLSVTQVNPAQRLYRRLGFREVPGTGGDIEMQWRG